MHRFAFNTPEEKTPENPIVEELGQMMEKDLKNFVTPEYTEEAGIMKERMKKASRVVDAVNFLKSKRTQIHTALALVTICSAGTLTHVALGLAGVLILIGPVIKVVGDGYEIVEQFQLMFDYCIKYHHTFLVISRMMQLVMIFMTNREHFKRIIYGRTLTELKSKSLAEKQAELKSKSLAEKQADVREGTHLQNMEFQSIRNMDSIDLTQKEALMTKWQDSGYKTKIDSELLEATSFPLSIYADLNETLKTLQELLIKKVDTPTLARLAEYDTQNLFDFKKSLEKRHNDPTYTFPELRRWWKTALSKDSLMNEFNECINRLGNGVLLMKTQVDLLFMYVERNCTPEEIKMLYTAVTTSVEFISYMQPELDIGVIVNKSALDRLRLFEESIQADITAYDKMKADLEATHQKLAEAAAREAAEKAQEAAEKATQEKAAQEAAEKAHEASQPERAQVASPKPKKSFFGTRSAKVAPAPAPAPAAAPAAAPAPAPAPKKTFLGKYFGFGGGRTKRRLGGSRKKRRLGGSRKKRSHRTRQRKRQM